MPEIFTEYCIQWLIVAHLIGEEGSIGPEDMEFVMEEDVLIPFIVFGSFAVSFIAWLYYKHKGRVETQQTMRLALEKGTELSPEFIRQLGTPEPDKDRDLRRSLIWFALAMGLVLIGFAVPEPEALRGLLAGAALPFSIGCAFMIMYVYGTKKES